MKADIKTLAEIKTMKEGGEKLSLILSQLTEDTKIGMTTLEIEKKAWDAIVQAGGYPAFAKVPGYHWATCININEGIVHGIPNDRIIQDGDAVSIDIGMFYKGFITDMSTTIQVGTTDPFTEHFLKTGKETLTKAINQAILGNRIGHISDAIDNCLKKEGFCPVPSLTGHGVGRRLHEYPAIPGLVFETIDQTPVIKEGMTLAIEVIYAAGTGDTTTQNDGWTIATADGKIAAVFEKTIAVMGDGPLLLTP